MSYLTRPFLGFIFALEPVWLPLFVVDVIALVVMIFAERFNPRTLIFWISLVVIVPFAGILLYLAFGSNLYTRWRLSGRKRSEDERFLGGEGDVPPEGDAVRAGCLEGLGADVYTSDNDVRFYWNRSEMTPDMVSDIRAAGESVCLMARRMPKDSAGVHEALIDAASRGVSVRVMTSAIGFGRTRDAGRLKRAGVSFHSFHNPLYSMFSIRPANRNLRAMTVIDGRIAYQGRGATVRVEGPAAERLERRFRADWFHATGEDLGTRGSPPERVEGGCGVQVVSDGPDTGDAYPMLSCYADLISRSDRTLYMAFPYLLPNDDIYSTVKMAVVSGVDVRILLPRRGKHWYQSWNSLAASNPLMMVGAKVYFVDRMLGKCVIISDGRMCCVGSGDLSSRPLAQDLNAGCLVYSEEVASEAEAAFMRELENGVECLPEEYQRRSFADVLKIGVARLLMFFN